MTIDRKRKQHDVVSSWTIGFVLAKSVSHVACFFSDTPGIYSEVGPMWHGMSYPKQGNVCRYEAAVYGKPLSFLRAELKPPFYMKTYLKRYQFFHFGGVVSTYFIKASTHLLHLRR